MVWVMDSSVACVEDVDILLQMVGVLSGVYCWIMWWWVCELGV